MRVIMLLLLAPTRRCFTTPLAQLRGAALRRFASSALHGKKRVVFLGSPGVAAETLSHLVAASKDAESCFEIVGCVSQPPAAKGRRRVVQKSDVHARADELGLETLTPAKARDAEFLQKFKDWEPDLCVTAAYGQFLPRTFLEIPEFGTLNIHPSLLPRWRGAAPLQRSLEAGDPVIGVTVLKTVLAMDAGPIVAQETREVQEGDEAEALLAELFEKGAKLLVESLPSVFDGTLEAREQDEAGATAAPKLEASEAKIDLVSSRSSSIAQVARDKVRAFSPWPGTWLGLKVGGADEELRLKVLDACLIDDDNDEFCSLKRKENLLVIKCADGSRLGLRTVQPNGKKPMDARSFWNGLQGATIEPYMSSTNDDPKE